MRFMISGGIGMAAAVLLSAGSAWAAGDAAAGKTIFNKCAVCHAITPGTNKIGPSLYGVVGRHSASMPNYTYTEAMKAHNVTWTPEELDKYLVAPREVVKGTKMIFAGLKTEQERQDVIAYLETLK